MKTIENLLGLSVRQTGCEKFHSVVVCEWILSVIRISAKKKRIVASNVGHWCGESQTSGGMKNMKNNHDEIYLNNTKKKWLGMCQERRRQPQQLKDNENWGQEIVIYLYKRKITRVTVFITYSL